jgi:hypothetical protein
LARQGSFPPFPESFRRFRESFRSSAGRLERFQESFPPSAGRLERFPECCRSFRESIPSPAESFRQPPERSPPSAAYLERLPESLPRFPEHRASIQNPKSKIAAAGGRCWPRRKLPFDDRLKAPVQHALHIEGHHFGGVAMAGSLITFLLTASRGRHVVARPPAPHAPHLHLDVVRNMFILEFGNCCARPRAAPGSRTGRSPTS